MSRKIDPMFSEKLSWKEKESRGSKHNQRCGVHLLWSQPLLLGLMITKRNRASRSNIWKPNFGKGSHDNFFILAHSLAKCLGEDMASEIQECFKPSSQIGF